MGAMLGMQTVHKVSRNAPAPAPALALALGLVFAAFLTLVMGSETGRAQVAAPQLGGGEVCFFTKPYYAGQRWCLSSGRTVNVIADPIWNRAISSIRVDGAPVHVCQEPFLKGKCTIFAQNWPRLGSFDNGISSFAVLRAAATNGAIAR